MKRFDGSTVAGILLILLGGMFLLEQQGLIDSFGDGFFGLAFLVGGAAFLLTYRSGSWWAVIPGCVLAAIGALILLPNSLENIGGFIFLGGLALAFWLTYLGAREERWWALIPAGVLSTLAVVSALPPAVGDFGGAVFFFGMSSTFLLVALLAKMRWGYYPAAALGALGFVVLFSLGGVMNYVSAVVLIGAGGFLLYRYFRPTPML